MVESSIPGSHIIDLHTVKPAELDDLWQHEMRVWRDRLLWDVSGIFVVFRRLLERRSVRGKVVQVEGRTVGYAYYVIHAGLGMICGLTVSPDWSHTEVGETLLQATVDALRRQGVSRIESEFVSFDCPWLVPAFARQGFRTAWREFQRLELRPVPESAPASAMVQLQPWQWTHLHQAAAIMQAAYDGGVEAEMNALYRSADDCRMMLENILSQSGSGVPVEAASALARHRGQGIGFALMTEIAPRQGHLAQVAVLPGYQRQGVGRLLLHSGMSRLIGLEFDTLSLIVSRANQRALLKDRRRTGPDPAAAGNRAFVPHDHFPTL